MTCALSFVPAGKIMTCDLCFVPAGKYRTFSSWKVLQSYRKEREEILSSPNFWG